MFSIDCMHNKGYALSVCKHNYFVGTCCRLPDHNNFVGIVYDLRDTESGYLLEARRLPSSPSAPSAAASLVSTSTSRQPPNYDAGNITNQPARATSPSAQSTTLALAEEQVMADHQQLAAAVSQLVVPPSAPAKPDERYVISSSSLFNNNPIHPPSIVDSYPPVESSALGSTTSRISGGGSESEQKNRATSSSVASSSKENEVILGSESQQSSGRNSDANVELGSNAIIQDSSSSTLQGQSLFGSTSSGLPFSYHSSSSVATAQTPEMEASSSSRAPIHTVTSSNSVLESDAAASSLDVLGTLSSAHSATNGNKLNHWSLGTVAESSPASVYATSESVGLGVRDSLAERMTTTPVIGSSSSSVGFERHYSEAVESHGQTPLSAQGSTVSVSPSQLMSLMAVTSVAALAESSASETESVRGALSSSANPNQTGVGSLSTSGLLVQDQEFSLASSQTPSSSSSSSPNSSDELSQQEDNNNKKVQNTSLPNHNANSRIPIVDSEFFNQPQTTTPFTTSLSTARLPTIHIMSQSSSSKQSQDLESASSSLSRDGDAHLAHSSALPTTQAVDGFSSLSSSGSSSTTNGRMQPTITPNPTTSNQINSTTNSNQNHPLVSSSSSPNQQFVTSSSPSQSPSSLSSHSTTLYASTASQTTSSSSPPKPNHGAGYHYPSGSSSGFNYGQLYANHHHSSSPNAAQPNNQPTSSAHSNYHLKTPNGVQPMAAKTVSPLQTSNNLIPNLSHLQSAILSHMPFKLATGLSSGLSSYLQAAMKPNGGRPLLASNTATALQFNSSSPFNSGSGSRTTTSGAVKFPGPTTSSTTTASPMTHQTNELSTSLTGSLQTTTPSSGLSQASSVAPVNSSSPGNPLMGWPIHGGHFIPERPAFSITNPLSQAFRDAQLVCGRPQTNQPAHSASQAAALTVNSNAEVKKRMARIVGGAQSVFGQWPWMVSLRQWRKGAFLHKCGAALLNENWAITAAHCVER